jgi:choline dehydrogenase
MAQTERKSSTRRTFMGSLAAAWAMFRPALNASVSGLRNIAFQRGRSSGAAPPEFEYIVVGSGAGGGTVASRLAEMGHRVLVLEAGGDPLTESGGNASYPDMNTLPDDYKVPAFHPNATENDAMKWDFFVRHFEDTEKQKSDPKYYATYKGDPVDGVLYPRAGTLGGCTAHNAMIFVYPHNDDWQHIADLTCDPSWAPENMRKYFERLENCHYRPLERFWHSLFRANPSRHGYAGWLRTEKALPISAALGDRELSAEFAKGVSAGLAEARDKFKQFIQDLEGLFDPNDWSYVKDNARGVRYTPLTTSNHARTGTRDRLREVESRSKGLLRIETNALVTRVLFEGTRAVGVEYRSGRRLYRPHGTPAEQGETKTVRASAEVILCGGAFNTPQLLMLSGIGPQDQLGAHGITPVKVLDGVGRNLQDRYEIGVVHKLDKPLKVLDDATFKKDDKPWREWHRGGKGIYQSNGAILAVIEKSVEERPLPDLFCFCLTGDFRGYYPGYSTRFPMEHDRLTWAVLKAHTQNHAGRVTLKSADPREAPHVAFHYFEEGTDTAGQDLDSVVKGVELVRTLAGKLPFMTEEFPGSTVTGDALREFVRSNAWGHHASCTCQIGDEKDGGVLDSEFRVHGVTGLRVVDASIFPKIPGFFIVSSIYIAAEKAAAVIHAGSKSAGCRSA